MMRLDRPAGTLSLLGYVFVLVGAALFWTTTSWPIGFLTQFGVPTWVSPLLLAEVIEWLVVVGGFLLISRLSAGQIGLRLEAIPGGLVGGVIVWVLAQGIALGPTGAVVATNSARPLLLTVPGAPGLLLAYAAAGVLEETEFRGILLGQIVARLRGATGAGVASAVALLASTAVFALLHIPSFASFGWTDMRLLPTALQEVAIMGLALGLCYLLTGNLIFAMVVHALFDSAELVLLGRVDGPVAHPFVAAGLIVALAWGALRWLHLRRDLDDQRSQSELGIGGLLVWLAVFGVALAGLEQLAGWPAQPGVPDHWPSWAVIQVWLNSPLAGLGTLVPVALDIGWAVWALTAASILLQASVDLLDAATRGAAWVRSLRLATSWLVLPPIRRAVDASLGGLLLARVLVQPATAAEASSVPTAGIVSHAPEGVLAAASSPFRIRGTGAVSAEIETPAADGETQTTSGAVLEVIYTVQPHDTLWALGLRFFGNPERGADLIFEANQGRRQSDGRLFDRRGLIFPGWTLRIPNPTQGMERAVDGTWWYTVQFGDTLSGICARLLGGPERVDEVFELNRGAHSPDGHVLLTPNLIWPGLRLRIPQVETSASEPLADEPAPEAAAAPTPVTASGNGVAADRQDRVSTEAPTPTASVPPAVPAADVETPATSQPTSQPPSPTPIPTIRPAEQAQPAGGHPVSPAGAAVGAAGLAAAALAASRFVVRRRRPAPIPNEPESDVRIENGFAEADPVEDLARRLAHTSDPAAAIASLLGQAYRAIFDEQLQPEERREASEGVSVAATRHGRTSTTLVLAAPVVARPYLGNFMRVAAERAFGEQVDVDGLVGQDGDVLVRVTWHPRRPIAGQLLDGVNAGIPSAWPAPCLVPALVLRDRQHMSINWHTLRNVLVAAPTGQGAEVPVTALVASLASRCMPEDLGLVVVARAHTLPHEVGVFPHGLLDVVDPASPDAVRQALESVRLEIDRRLEMGGGNEADLVVVVRELADIEPDAMQILSTIAATGPRYGARLLAASERPVADLLRICPFIDHFGTRLVRQTASEEDSVALLGMPGAEYLGAGGLAFLRMEGRLPVQGWTRHVSADSLGRLVHMMGTRAPAVTVPSDDGPVAPDEWVEGDEPQNNADAHTTDAAAQGSEEPAAATRAGSQLLRRLRSAPIRVRCFGGGDAWYGDRLLEIGDPRLLLLLAVHPVTGIQTEALADMLWDKIPDDINSALRKERYKLRNELRRLAPEVTDDPLPGNQAHGEKVVWMDTSIVSSDVHEFTELLKCAEKQEPAAAIELYEAALGLYGGDLLEGLNVPSYRWMYDEDPQIAVMLRSDLRRRQKETRLRLAELLARGPEAGLTRAEELYLGLCAEDPEDERLWTALFRIHERTGSVLGLKGAVHRLRGALAELGADGVTDVDSVPLPPNLDRMVEAIRSRIDGHDASSS